MKWNLAFIVVIIWSTSLFGQLQNPSPISILNLSHSLEKFVPADQTLNPESFVENHYRDFGLESPEDFQFQIVAPSKNGWKHLRYQQYYKGLKVVGASYILHEKDGMIRKSSGNVLPHIKVNTKPDIGYEEIVESVLLHYQQFAGENKEEELNEGQMFNANYYWEDPELCIVDLAFPEKSGKYRLAYQLDFHNEKNSLNDAKYLVDAITGKVIYTLPITKTISVPGKANTKYYGEVDIVADSVGPSEYVLRDFSRGDGIITLNDAGSGSYLDFTDEDNYWDNQNENKDEIAGDVHYSASSFYDYLLDKFNWSGINGTGEKLQSHVHLGGGLIYVNATWNGSNANFGDGDCYRYGPLTSLDVVGHEFAHGITDRTSDLIYRNESGALNESISDIFGKALEYVYDPGGFNWDIGGIFVMGANTFPFRSMSDPNLRGDPKYYLGNHWYFGTGDNGGVHTNSGVFNYWFYLLVEGGSGTNEQDYNFNVTSIGLDKAMDIVFGIQTGYLTPNSTYFDAFESSVEVAKDLYGANSQELVSVLEAWKTVGLDAEALENDLGIGINSTRHYNCLLDGTYNVPVFIKNLGNTAVPAGEMLNVRFLFNGDVVSDETVTLSEDLVKGDSVKFDFDTNIPIVLGADSTFIEAILLRSDGLPLNNRFYQEINVVNSAEDDDIELIRFTLTPLNGCAGGNTYRMYLLIRNRGCTPRVSGYTMPVEVSIENQIYPLNVTYNSGVNVGTFYGRFVNIDFDDISPGHVPVEVTIGSMDENLSNNTLSDTFIVPLNLEPGFEEDFSTFEIDQDINFTIGGPSFNNFAVVNYNGNEMLGFTGNPPSSSLQDCLNPEKFNNQYGASYASEMSVCINAQGINDPVFYFDLIQIRSDSTVSTIREDYKTIVQVIFPSQYGLSYPLINDQESGEQVTHEVPLPLEYNDEITLRILSFKGSSLDLDSSKFDFGDFNLIDNVGLSDLSTSIDLVPSQNQFNVFPNPVAGSEVNFYRDENAESIFEVLIYNSFGQQIHSSISTRGSSLHSLRIYNSGIYFYKIREEGKTLQTGKLVVGEKL